MARLAPATERGTPSLADSSTRDAASATPVGTKRLACEMHHTRSAVVPFIIRDAPGVLRRLHLLEQQGMITFFDTQDIVQSVVLQGLNMRGIGTQAVFGDDQLEVGVVLAQFGDQALGGIAFAIILLRSITVHNRLRHERIDSPLVRMDDRSA